MILNTTYDGKLIFNFFYYVKIINCVKISGKMHCVVPMVVTTNQPFLSGSPRYNYSNLWHSIINMDLKGIENWSRELGSHDMYLLLATIVTGRAWDVVGEQGIQK